MAQILTRDEVRRRAGLFTVTEAATLFEMRPRRLRYYLECGLVACPSIRIANKPRRYYAAEDLATIKATLKERQY